MKINNTKGTLTLKEVTFEKYLKKKTDYLMGIDLSGLVDELNKDTAKKKIEKSKGL